MSNVDWEAVNDIFQQLLETLERIQLTMKAVTKPDVFCADEEGREKLDALCMKLLTIGELLKTIDKKTNKTLLVQYVEIDWTGFMGLRDVIAHDYFNLNPIQIFEICTREIEPLKVTIEKIMANNQDCKEDGRT